jgi:hypothetical protein
LQLTRESATEPKSMNRHCDPRRARNIPRQNHQRDRISRCHSTSGSLQDIDELFGKPFLRNALQVVSRMT